MTKELNSYMTDILNFFSTQTDSTEQSETDNKRATLQDDLEQ